MIKTEIQGGDSNKSVDVINSEGHGLLTSTSLDKIFGTFKASTRATAGTTIIVQPSSGESIVLTDLIVTAEKRGGGGILTVRFTDGTNTVNIAVVNIVDAPANFAIPFAGKWQGWLDARIEMVTDQNFATTVSCGYRKVSSKYTFLYAEWDAQR